jgi:hypothetical protein
MNTSTKPVKPVANKQPPAREIRVNGVRATLGKNDTDKGPRFNTTFERSDKDGEEWKTSNAFGRDDLLILGFTTPEALDWLKDGPKPLGDFPGPPGGGPRSPVAPMGVFQGKAMQGDFTHR